MKTKILLCAVMLFSITGTAQQITRHSLLSAGSVQTGQTKGKYILQQTNVRSIGAGAEKIAPSTAGENYFSIENIFPNPANTHVALITKSSVDGRVRFSVLTILGSMALETGWKEIAAGRINAALDISSLEAGLYFIHASFLNADGSITASASLKLIKLY